MTSNYVWAVLSLKLMWIQWSNLNFSSAMFCFSLMLLCIEAADSCYFVLIFTMSCFICQNKFVILPEFVFQDVKSSGNAL
ncbi:hypothetical protein ACQUZI_10130, partial [Streptococcus pyogenes]|uniref:hypothetical protein n=1 Tax=Streptococcus pyogenes TaxID=1314 RepID=UPI003DA15A1C